MEICSFGCGQPANFRLKNGRFCCSPSHNGCPAKKARHGQHAFNWFESMTLVCPNCGGTFTRRRDLVENRNRTGKPVTCSRCSNREASRIKWEILTEEQKENRLGALHQGVRDYYANLSTEDRQERSRKAGSANTGFAVQQQWISIKASPEKLQRVREQRGKTFKATWDGYTPDQRAARTQKALKKTGHSSTGDKFLGQLRDRGLTLEPEQAVSGFLVDGLHRESGTIVEFYGDFWHCNPERHKDPDQYCSWIKRTVGQQWARDRKRLGVFYSLGFKVVIVWESHWNANPDCELQRVLDAVGK